MILKISKIKQKLTELHLSPFQEYKKYPYNFIK